MLLFGCGPYASVAVHGEFARMIGKPDFLVVLAQSGDAVIESHAGVSIAQFAHSLAVAYIGMGNNDQALAWLEKAYREHSGSLTALKVDPIYDPLRSDPRFQALVRRVGLAE